MASVCDRKRPNADALAQDTSPAKRLKPANFPPSFWDNLSRVWLKPRALRELDRRNRAQHRSTEPTEPLVSRQLAQFARCGGPDLRHLRAFPVPQECAAVMTSTPFTPPPSRRTQSTIAASAGSRTNKSSAYGNDFQQHLIDHKVYPAGYKYADDGPDPEPHNLDSVHDELLAARASLSPSRFPQSAFRAFNQRNAAATFESDVMASVVPTICGDAAIPSKQNVLFTELEPITDSNAVRPKPDLFDGARLQDLGQELRDDQNLGSTIVPTKHPSVPIAPNFFLEVKGPNGNPSVAQRQACYDGAHGARAMHALQTYGDVEPVYDGNAYTYSSTYNAGTGTLQLYAHHATTSNSMQGQPEYHMTQLRSFGLTDTRETFVAGATALRNMRDLAKRHRDGFIGAANARAAAMVTVQEDVTDKAVPLSPEMHESTGCSGYVARQNADYALQQQIADSSGYPLQGDAEATATPRFLCTEDDSQYASREPALLDCGDPPLISALDPKQLPSKRPRTSINPPTGSKRAHPSGSRARVGTDPRATQSPAPTTSTPSGSSESYWVETYLRKGKILLQEPTAAGNGN